MLIKALFAAVLGLLITACAAPMHMGPDFGYSYRVNTTVQLQDPTAEGREHPPIMGDGQKTEQSLEHYRKDKPEVTRERIVTGISN